MAVPRPVEPWPVSALAGPLRRAQIMSQWWLDISFLHWRVDPDRIAPLLPEGTVPDVYDGGSWVGLIPFRMVDAGVGPGARRPVARDLRRDQCAALLCRRAGSTRRGCSGRWRHSGSVWSWGPG